MDHQSFGGEIESLTTTLSALIKRLSYREGDFTLVSGQKSKFYVDLKATTLHPEGAALIGETAYRVLAEWARREGVKVDGVGGLTLGADPLATAISLAAWEAGETWPAFIVRKEPKAHGTGRYIEGTENLPARANLVVLEDVVTTGASSIKAVERLKEAGYEPRVALTVVDREQGGKAEIERAGVKFLTLTTLEKVQAAK